MRITFSRAACSWSAGSSNSIHTITIYTDLAEHADGTCGSRKRPATWRCRNSWPDAALIDLCRPLRDRVGQQPLQRRHPIFRHLCAHTYTCPCTCTCTHYTATPHRIVLATAHRRAFFSCHLTGFGRGFGGQQLDLRLSAVVQAMRPAAMPGGIPSRRNLPRVCLGPIRSHTLHSTCAWFGSGCSITGGLRGHAGDRG